MECLLSWLFSVLLFGTAYQSFLDVHNLPDSGDHTLVFTWYVFNWVCVMCPHDDIKAVVS